MISIALDKSQISGTQKPSWMKRSTSWISEKKQEGVKFCFILGIPYEELSGSIQCWTKTTLWTILASDGVCFKTSIFVYRLINDKEKYNFQFQESGSRHYLYQFSSLQETKGFQIIWGYSEPFRIARCENWSSSWCLLGTAGERRNYSHPSLKHFNKLSDSLLWRHSKRHIQTLCLYFRSICTK